MFSFHSIIAVSGPPIIESLWGLLIGQNMVRTHILICSGAFPDRVAVAVATLSGIKLTQRWRKLLKIWLGHNIYIKIVPGCHFYEEKTLETKHEENQKLPNNVWERSQVVPPPLQCYY